MTKVTQAVTSRLRGDITCHYSVMPMTEHQRLLNREKQRRWRERQKKKQVVGPGEPATDGDDDPADAASGQLAPSGIDAPSAKHEDADDSGPVRDLMIEQALWVRERRKISTLEYQRRRGLLIEVEEARQQNAALGRKIRAALDRAPAHLPADLSPDARAACTAAMSQAIKAALRHLADD